MVFGGIALNMEINMDLHHHHAISSQSYQPFSLLVGGVRSHQKQRAHGLTLVRKVVSSSPTAGRLTQPSIPL